MPSFIIVGYVCQILGSEVLVDMVWFVKIVQEIKATENIEGDYGHKVIEGQIYLKGHCLEGIGDTKKIIKYKINTKQCTSQS